ncbi:MAG: hypothetical protein V3W33_00810, partial [Gammaproteobacteria bacterium]
MKRRRVKRKGYNAAPGRWRSYRLLEMRNPVLKHRLKVLYLRISSQWSIVMFYLRGIILALGLFMAAFFSYADVLLLESIRDTADVPRPAGGTTMVQVEQKYGAPEQRLG